MVDLLLRVVFALISCLCLCFCCFFGCHRFFFSTRRRVCRGFFSEGEEDEKEETEAFWFSFVELRCLKLKFQVNFH